MFIILVRQKKSGLLFSPARVSISMKIYAFVWGWMRLAIGLAQMGFALAGAIMLLSNGFCSAMDLFRFRERCHNPISVPVWTSEGLNRGG